MHTRIEFAPRFRPGFRRVELSLVAAFALLSTACGRTGLDVPQCGDPGIQCTSVANTSSKVTYTCNIHLSGIAATVFGADHDGDLPVCLPSNLNRWIGNPSEVAAIDAMAPADYDLAVFQYGLQTVVQQLGNLKAVDATGGLCGAIETATADPFTYCKVKLGARDSFCETAANFTPQVCVPTECYNVIDPNSGNINPHACACNTTVQNQDDCNRPGFTVVIPSPGTGDPPGVSSGILAHELAAANAIELNPSLSTAQAHVHFYDHLSLPHDDTSTAAVSGTATLYGRRHSDGTSQMLFEFGTSIGDMAFHFSAVDVIGNVSIAVTGVKLSGGMLDSYIDFDSAGNGLIPGGALALNFEGNVDGKRVFIQGTNGPSLLAHADLQNNTFSIPAFTMSLTALDLTISIAGKIKNQPPSADAGPQQVLECSSGAGTPAVLHGSLSDPDGDFLGASWSKDVAFGSTHVVSHDLVATVIVPFAPPALETTYFLSTQDAQSQIARAKTAVLVRDTTPPHLTLAVDPSCIWPPNHQMVLYELGSSIQAGVTDACDVNPTVRITGVTSNQPPTGGGSGNTPFDILFGKRAFCVRAERDGTLSTPREYTVSVTATDASANETLQTIVIRVQHDQNDPKCKNVPSAQVVADNDPRCSAN